MIVIQTDEQRHAAWLEEQRCREHDADVVLAVLLAADLETINVNTH